MPSAHEPERLLTVDEVAARLGMGEETVRRWLRRGELRGVRLAKRLGWRVRESDLEAYIQAHLTDGENRDS